MYDRLDTVDRDPVILDELDLLDDDGDEIPIFTHDGRQVPRRIPLSKASRRPCGILLDFTNARDLFEDPRDNDLAPELNESPPPYVMVNAFRQGFLHSVGHVQVNAVPFPMVPLIANINAAVAIDAAQRDPDDEDDDEDDERIPLPLSAVTGIDCQMYNSVMHRVRGTAQTHDAQRGDVTAAFAGSYSEGATQKRKASRLREACRNRLPHENFSMLIDHDGLDTSLRMECVHRIDLTMLRPERRAGKYVPVAPSPCIIDRSLITIAFSCIYLYIIVPLTSTWTEPRMFAYLKDHLVVLRPNVSLLIYGYCLVVHG